LSKGIISTIIDVAGETSGYAPMNCGHKVALDVDQATRYQSLNVEQATGILRIKLDAAPGAGKSITLTAVNVNRNGGSPTDVQSFTLSEAETEGQFGISTLDSETFQVWKVTADSGHGVSVLRASLVTEDLLEIPGPNWLATSGTPGIQNSVAGFSDGLVSVGDAEKWQMSSVARNTRVSVYVPYGVTGEAYFFRNVEGVPEASTSIQSQDGGGSYDLELFPGDIIQVMFIPTTGSSRCRAALANFTAFDFAEIDSFPMLGGFDPLVFGSNPTQYASPFADDESGTVESDHQIVLPAGATIDQLYVRTKYAPGTGRSLTFTLRKNGVDTALTAALTGSSQTQAQDTANEVQAVAGDLLSVGITDSGGSFTRDWIAVGFRLVAVNGSIAETGSAHLQGPKSIAQTGFAYIAPIAGIIAQDGFAVLQGATAIAETGSAYLVQAGIQQTGSAHLIRSLDGGFGWLGPWTSYDGEE
jgi:hypothetical protein